jgi:hypothetical protein
VSVVVKLFHENLALAVLWGAIAFCAIGVLLAPGTDARDEQRSGFSAAMTHLARTGF